MNDGKSKDVVMMLQIPKTITIDKNTTIGDIKRLSKQQFNKYSDDFNIFIKDFDISTLENMNAIRTFDYYKSNTLSLHPKSLSKSLLTLSEKQMNESNLVMSRDMNTDIENTMNNSNGNY